MTYLITNPTVSKLGVQVWNLEQVRADTGMLKMDIESAYDELVLTKRMIEFGGYYIWTPDRWSMEPSKNDLVMKSIEAEIAEYPIEFREIYNTYPIDSLSVGSQYTETKQKQDKKQEANTEKDTDSLESPDGDPGKSNGDASEKKPRKPYLERNMKTPAGKFIQCWHKDYLERFKRPYTGNIVKMGGQAKELFKKKVTEDTMYKAMAAFLDEDASEYNQHHTFDTFIKRFNHYAGIGEEKYE